MSKTAAMLLIGDEILSGRTQDTNSNYVARQLTAIGIDLSEVRVVGDAEDEIVAALNALRSRYDFVFTTGGIGPTHDDITADAVAKAFDVGIGYHPEAYALLEARYAPGEFNEARKRMARIPDGGALIKNSASVAPGFQIGNVFVMAGVPMVMRAMMEEILPRLPHGAPVLSVTISTALPEGTIAQGLADIQKSYPQTVIGSYPWVRDGKFGAQLVVRSRDASLVEEAARAIEALAVKLGATPERISST
ncbi:MAG TPA: molybdopterin-binding protein [Rhizomicrobium sp.]|jgi:molybdenum cofactor synthesis domain-containing protein|nr:molybdopterin-binding protein [Rhizomicrobium sp.]